MYNNIDEYFVEMDLHVLKKIKILNDLIRSMI